MKWIFTNDGGFLVCSDQSHYAYSYPTSENAERARRDAYAIARIEAERADREAHLYIPQDFYRAQQQHFAAAFAAAEQRAHDTASTPLG